MTGQMTLEQTKTTIDEPDFITFDISALIFLERQTSKTAYELCTSSFLLVCVQQRVTKGHYTGELRTGSSKWCDHT